MKRIIIADDENWIRRGIIQSIPWQEWDLELAGEAEDGEEAFELTLREKPDVLFMDMRMPGWDGRMLLARLHESFPELVTIVVSGYSDFAYTREAVRYKAFDYLLKPVKGRELREVLQKALKESGRRKAGLADVPPEDHLRDLLQRSQDSDPQREETVRSILAAKTHWRSKEWIVGVVRPDREPETGLRQLGARVEVDRAAGNRMRPG